MSLKNYATATTRSKLNTQRRRSRRTHNSKKGENTMSKKSKAEIDIRVTIAAGLFANYTRDAKEIARLLNTTERNIHRWAERQRWDEVLQILKYNGERNFRVRPARDMQSSPDFEKAKTAYSRARENGIPKHKLATLVSNELGISYRTVLEWAKAFGWNT